MASQPQSRYKETFAPARSAHLLVLGKQGESHRPAGWVPRDVLPMTKTIYPQMLRLTSVRVCVLQAGAGARGVRWRKTAIKPPFPEFLARRSRNYPILKKYGDNFHISYLCYSFGS